MTVSDRCSRVTHKCSPAASLCARPCASTCVAVTGVCCMWSKTSSYGFAHLINNESQHNDTFFQCITGEMGSKLPWSPSCLHPWHRRPSPQPRHRLPKTNTHSMTSFICTDPCLYDRVGKVFDTLGTGKLPPSKCFCSDKVVPWCHGEVEREEDIQSSAERVALTCNMLRSQAVDSLCDFNSSLSHRGLATANVQHSCNSGLVLTVSVARAVRCNIQDRFGPWWSVCDAYDPILHQ